MSSLTKEQIENNAKLCASSMSGEESDCLYKEGTSAYKIWISAFKSQCKTDSENAKISYEMHPENNRHS